MTNKTKPKSFSVIRRELEAMAKEALARVERILAVVRGGDFRNAAKVDNE